MPGCLGPHLARSGREWRRSLGRQGLGRTGCRHEPQTLESLFAFARDMLRSWRAAFLFFTRFPAAWGQQRERHRLTSPGYFVFLCPPPIRAPTANTWKGAVGQGVDSFHGPPQRVVEQAPASPVPQRWQDSVTQWQPGDNCISSRATYTTTTASPFLCLGSAVECGGRARQNQAARAQGCAA